MPEIERKFLVRALPPALGEHRAEPIAQGYLATAPDGVEVRIRRRGEVTRVTLPAGLGAQPVGTVTEAKPKPPEPDDPRPAYWRNTGGPWVG